MRRVFSAVVAAFAVAVSAANAYDCSYNGVSLAGIPVTKPPLMIPQVVPTDPSLDSNRYWQLSLCTPQPYQGCSGTAPSYVIEINGNLDGCDVGFNNPLSDNWSSNYGGANALFGGTDTNPNDRIANVTLLCDPTATSLAAVGNVIAHSAQGGAVWVFDIVLKTTAVCGGPSPPSPPPITWPPPPSPPPTNASDIVTATFDALYCAGSGTTSSIAPGCAPVGLTASVLSVCTNGGATLQQLYFSNSTTCGGNPTLTETTQVGQCVNGPVVQSTSVKLLSCSNV